MKVGIQGERGSACDAAAIQLAKSRLIETNFEYFPTAKRTLEALKDESIDAAVLALESPVGVAVPETSQALASFGPIAELAELRSEVRHCIMVKRGTSSRIRKVASHPIPLEKHRKYLSEQFPDYQAVEVDDTGLAARLLSEGKLSDDTAVVAMPHAAEIFDLTVVASDLPANSDYLTRFALVRNPFPSVKEIKLLAARLSSDVPHYTELDSVLEGDDRDTSTLFYEDDARHSRYLVEVQRFVPNYHEMTAHIVGLAVAERPRLVLDAGLGPGNLALEILQRTQARLVGIDLSKEMVRWAGSTLARAASRVQLTVDDLQQVALPEACDVIITNLVLHNFPDEQKGEVLQKFFDSLVPNGLLLWGDTFRSEVVEEQNLVDWYRWKWALEHGASPDHVRRTFRKERGQDRPWTIARMEHSLRELGFLDVRVKYVQLGMAVLSARKPSHSRSPFAA